MDPAAASRQERGRICAALIEQVGERGYRSTGVDHVVRRAGLDQAAFSRHFENLEDCFAMAWHETDAELERRMYAACAEEKEWQDALRGALSAGLAYLAGNEGRARLYVSEARYVGEPLRERQRAALARLGAMIDEGRSGSASARTPHVSEAIAGAIWRRIELLVRGGRATDLPSEVPRLMYFAVLPYRGTAAGEAELLRPSAR